jgi:hypothetical protein
VYGSPTVFNGRVFIGGQNGMFYELDEATGAVLHSINTGYVIPCSSSPNKWGIAATATVASDPSRGNAATVYVTGGTPAGGSGGVYLWALDAKDLHPVWATDPVPLDTQPGSYSWASPTVSKHLITAGISSGCDEPLVRGGLAVVNQSDGSPVGTYYTVPSGTVGGGIWSSAMMSGSYSWVTTGNSDPTAGAIQGDSFSIVRLNGATKEDMWTDPGLAGTDQDFGASATMFRGMLGGRDTPMVGACNKNGMFYALRAFALHSGPVWSFRVGTEQPYPCLSAALWDAAHHQLIIGTNAYTTPDGTKWPGSIVGLSPDADLTSGASPSSRVIWRLPLPCNVYGTPTMDGAGVVAVETWKGCTSPATPTLYLLDPQNLVPDGYGDGGVSPQILKTIPLDNASFGQAVFADNYLFVGSDKDVIAYH